MQVILPADQGVNDAPPGPTRAPTAPPTRSVIASRDAAPCPWRVARDLLDADREDAVGKGDGGADIAALIRAVAWLAGQWLYGIRHRHYGSPLAGRLFPRTPLCRLDTSRGWACRPSDTTTRGCGRGL
jgi:hypothetical protein